MALHLPPLSSHQPFSLSLFLQSRETLCGEVLEGGAGGRLHQAAMQRDPPRRRSPAELQRPRPAVPHRDGHTGRGDQPEAETGCPQLLRPGESAAYLPVVSILSLSVTYTGSKTLDILCTSSCLYMLLRSSRLLIHWYSDNCFIVNTSSLPTWRTQPKKIPLPTNIYVNKIQYL